MGWWRLYKYIGVLHNMEERENDGDGFREIHEMICSLENKEALPAMDEGKLELMKKQMSADVF